MLLLGSAGRNSGKTELACSLIERLKSICDITGVKVTTVHERNSPCPRGGQGCGACSSFAGNYCITEEDSKTSGKDTTRMLASGAKTVYWVRAHSEHLTGATAELFGMLGPGAITIAESNSLSSIVEPGLFLMIRDAGAEAYKRSASKVLRFVDRMVLSDGERFDLDLDCITLDRGKWVLRT